MALMPINVNDGEQYAYSLAQAYADAEVAIVRALADAVSRGLDLDTLQDYQRAQLGQLQRMRKQVVAELRKVNTGYASNMVKRVNEAYRHGGLQMLAELDRASGPEVIPPARSAAVRALVADATRKLNDMQPQILRQADDIYRSIVAQVSARVAAAPNITRKRATQEAIQQHLANGVTGFVDKAGRNWSIADYATMALRTATAQAAIQGHLETAQSLNLTLCILRAGPRCCELCANWVDRVLSTDGSPAGTYRLNSETALEQINVEVYGTLDQARSDGWGHPNDRCNMQTYIPGATPTPEPTEWDETGYKAQQKQRALERGIRKSKIAHAAAIDPEEQRQALARVKEAQSHLRQHLADHPFLKRQSDREQIGGNYGPGNPRPRPPEAPPKPPRAPRAPEPAPAPPKPPVAPPDLKKQNKDVPDNELAAREKHLKMMRQFKDWSEKDIQFQSEAAKAAWAEAKHHSSNDIQAALNDITRRQIKVIQRMTAEAEAKHNVTPLWIEEAFSPTNAGRPLRTWVLAGANPDFRKDKNARVNCSYVVAAVELRRRGYAVEANPIETGVGRIRAETARDWFDPKTGTSRSFTDAANRAELEAAMDSWPVGARGFVSGAWIRFKGGHIFNVEKIGPGEYRYLEGQDTSVPLEGSARYPDQMKDMGVMRVDDLEPTQAMNKVVRKAK